MKDPSSIGATTILTRGDIAEALFQSLQEHELEVFYDLNEQYRILAEDVEEYLKPIYATEAQFVICVLGPMYPKKIWTKFESKHFEERFKSGEVIPVVLSTTQVGVFDKVGEVGHLTWDRGKDFSSELQRVTDVLVRKAAQRRSKAGGARAPAAQTNS